MIKQTPNHGRKTLRARGSEIKQIAKERMQILLEFANQRIRSDAALSRRYVHLARLVGMKAGVRLPRNVKMFICSKCDSLLRPGLTARVRTRSERGTVVVITCLTCGARKRYPVAREKRTRRLANR